MKVVYDPVRQKHVAATPEELVRQTLLQQMLGPLGYPRGLIAVEKEIALLKRRADLICYSGRELRPLLVVECKAEDCGPEARAQAFGYNQALGAPFVCVAGQLEIHTLWHDGQKISSVPFLPSYAELRRLFS